MTKQEQRIAIAVRHLGFRPIKGEKVSDCGHFTMLTADGNHLAFCPDYLNDLNAMRDAEKMIQKNPDHVFDYMDNLEQVTSFVPHFATAAQRAEAFLKTLNLWKP
jgi:hypothetical protein